MSERKMNVFWRYQIKPKHIQPILCNYCCDGKYIPSKHIDRCPKCLFIKNHSLTLGG